jgi:hypothetical protein
MRLSEDGVEIVKFGAEKTEHGYRPVIVFKKEAFGQELRLEGNFSVMTLADSEYFLRSVIEMFKQGVVTENPDREGKPLE